MRSLQNQLIFAVLGLLVLSGCGQQAQPQSRAAGSRPTPSPSVTVRPIGVNSPPQMQQIIEAAIEQTKVTTGYDPAYAALDYPNGDVPAETGVCSDVIVRAFRKAGIDLQKKVHEDMKAAWSAYPRKWGAARPDTNIDHRRVLNLMTYFDRQQKRLPITDSPADYAPGDVVAWDLGNGIDHIGIVVNTWSETSQSYLIVHNIGAGARLEDVLFAWKITGHYRYFPVEEPSPPVRTAH